MTIIECPHCGRSVMPNKNVCPSCREDVTDLAAAATNRQRNDYRELMLGLIAGGKSKAVIIECMTAEVGASPGLVEDLWEECYAHYASTGGERGPRDLVLGLCWLGGGIAVTVGTFVLADPHGGTFLLAWGPIVYGAIMFAVGVRRFLHSRARVRLDS